MKTTRKPNIERWPVKNLIPYELNAKKHDPDQVARIVKSIQKFGFHGVIMVDKHGVIIAGHGRRLALMQLGIEDVNVDIRSDLSADEVKALRLADNRAGISDIDSEKLRQDMEGFDIELLEGIFDMKEINFLDADLGVVNTNAFIDNMDTAVSEQKTDLDGRISGAKAAPVQLYKAFGFKDVPGGSQLVVTQFMALAEAHTGLTGGDALIQFMRDKFVEVA